MPSRVSGRGGAAAGGPDVGSRGATGVATDETAGDGRARGAVEACDAAVGAAIVVATVAVAMYATEVAAGEAAGRRDTDGVGACAVRTQAAGCDADEMAWRPDVAEGSAVAAMEAA